MITVQYDFLAHARLLAEKRKIPLASAIQALASENPEAHAAWLAAQREQTPTARRYAALQKGGATK